MWAACWWPEWRPPSWEAITPMNGFNMQEAENLILYGADKGLKVSGLLVCGVLISALGAVMDVALGIALLHVWK